MLIGSRVDQSLVIHLVFRENNIATPTDRNLRTYQYAREIGSRFEKWVWRFCEVEFIRRKIEYALMLLMQRFLMFAWQTLDVAESQLIHSMS